MAHQRRRTTRFMRMGATAVVTATALVASLALTAPATQAVTPTIPDGLLSTTQLAVGDVATCAITTEQTIACWGTPPSVLATDSGSDFDEVRRALPVAGTVLEGKPIAKVRAGGIHFCALAVDGTFACWGYNKYGQLGDGTTTGRTRPVAVAVAGTVLEGNTIKDFALGTYSTCALTTDDVLACWGSRIANAFGPAALVPEGVSTQGTSLEGETVAGIDVGHDFVCGWATAGAVTCWTAGSPPRDVAMTGTALEGQDLAELDLQWTGACALGVNGAVACWGINTDLQLVGALFSSTTVPVDKDMTGTALAGKQVIQVAGLYRHTCAIASDGTVACWGRNGMHQLGDGTTTDSGAPVALTTAGTVLEGKTVVELGAGYDYSCARASDGTTACWGDYPIGGNGTNAGSPVPAGVVGAIAVAAAPSVKGVTGTSATSASIAWTPADEDGGLPRTGYTITASPGGATKNVGADETSTTITGLTPGLAYTLAVTANNALGASEAGTATLLGSGLTLASTAKQVTYGRAATLNGTLTDSTGAALAGRTVSLRRTVWPSTTSLALANVVTDAKGSFSFVVTPRAATTYTAAYVGGTGVTGRPSAPVSVALAPSISLGVNDGSVSRGQTVTFSGTIAPDARGRTVYLQRLVNGRWSTAASKAVTSKYGYSIPWTPRTLTDFTFRVVLPAGNGQATGISNTRRLTVS